MGGGRPSQIAANKKKRKKNKKKKKNKDADCEEEHKYKGIYDLPHTPLKDKLGASL